MTYILTITGSENLQGDAKIDFERDVIAKAREFVGSLTGVLTATVSTNSQGSTNLLEVVQ